MQKALSLSEASGHHFVFMLVKKKESCNHYPTGMAGMADYSNLYLFND